MATFTFMIMAKINNAQIIQKLIDELKLYPGTDVIPTELAEKILPVFQINDQSIIFAESGQPRFIAQAVAGNTTNTLTVPEGKKWRLDLFTFQFETDVNVTNRLPRVQIKDQFGNLIMEGSNNRLGSIQIQTASKDWQYVCGNVNFHQNSNTAGVVDDTHWSIDGNDEFITMQFKLPVDKLVLPEGWTINVFATNGVAGDMITTRVQVNEEKNNFTS